MPRKNRNFSRQRESSKNLQRNILIVAGIVVAVIIVVAIAANQSTPATVTDTARELGSATAPVVVEEFADFQCPWCGVFNTTVEVRLREQYINTGKVRFIFRNYPIVDSYVANGTESHLAALAALCAGEQNMFWDYHDLLFRSQNPAGENLGAFSTPRLQAMAAQLHLDSVRFDQCLSNQSYANVLEGDIRLAQYYKISATPSFFVNGVQVTGTSEDFQWLFDAIDRALSTMGI
jgi:protein-disulfide isomerase